jgi:hypothetical protein
MHPVLRPRYGRVVHVEITAIVVGMSAALAVAGAAVARDRLRLLRRFR